MRKLKFLLLVLAGLLLVSCLKEGKREDSFRTLEITVLAETEFICGYPCNPEEEKREAMVIKGTDGKKGYLYLGSIKGFTFEKGYQYRLLIEERFLANPPADGPEVVYTLIKEISKEEKQ